MGKKSIVLLGLLQMSLLLNATVIWHDDLAITTDVFNQNIDIYGTNQITKPGGHLHVSATNTDIIVTVTGVDSVLTSSLQLHFYAAEDLTITLSLTNDLLLRGSQSDFLITFSGLGKLQAYVAGGNELALTSLVSTNTAIPSSGGVTFLILEETPAVSGAMPTFSFSRFPLQSVDPNPSESSQHSYLSVGPSSIIAFGSTQPVSSGGMTQQGKIILDGSNYTSALGRTILQMATGASFLTAGGYVSTYIDPTVNNINFTIPAGLQAITQIPDNTGAPDVWNGFMVVNGNIEWNQLCIDPFCESNYTTTRTGFILGANGEFIVGNDSYLDYVVTATNVSLFSSLTTPTSILGRRPIETAVKDRNPAAFIVDGDSNANATDAVITLSGTSCMYFRSAVDYNGDWTFETTYNGETVISFTIQPDMDIKTEGTTVFDVEGTLNIIGDATKKSALELLSLYVTPTGGSVLIYDQDVVFPNRNFAVNSDGLELQYGSGNFLFNNLCNLISSNLKHTDEIHAVFEKNIVAQSSACYISGESMTLGCPHAAPQNQINFNNSDFHIHTDVAFTADLGITNTANFIFYTNGRCIDNGTGRQFNLGTEVGGEASDGKTIIKRDAQLDLIQVQPSTSSITAITLNLLTLPNNQKIDNGIIGCETLTGCPILGQYAVHTLFLGWASNISIGTNGSVGTSPYGETFPLTLYPQLNILADFIAFETQGGTINSPELSMTTGEGGMFVDTNGTVSISPLNRCSFGMMVTKSRNGVINLPKSQAFFRSRVGTAQWELNLGDPSQLVVIGPGDNLSDYNIDWKNLIKDYCSGPNLFVPYELNSIPLTSSQAPVIPANIQSIPVIQGTIDQFQIKNSRLGDQATVMVDGGYVRELVLLTGDASGTAPVGVVVMQNNALVGFGTASRNVDSLDASAMLGVNGLSIIANGDATLRLNEDTLINNVCHILTGTLFGVGGPNRLLIDSVVPRELRVKSDGTLDLSQFTNVNQTLEIGGDVSLVLEPGAQVIMGGGNLVFSGNASLYCEPFTDLGIVTTVPSDIDPFRVKWSGTGQVNITENATVQIPRGAYFGIESINPVYDYSETTTQVWTLTDNAQFQLGSPTEFGGVFQVGNTTPVTDGVVTFSLVIDGTGTNFGIYSQGFLGLGAGIASKPFTAPNTWLVNTLYNVSNISINLTNGTITHSQIYSGDNNAASLIGIANTTGTTFSFTFDRVNGLILGGGNIALLNTAGTSYAPTVLTTSGVIDANHSASILAPSQTLLDPSITAAGTATPGVSNTTGAGLFGFIQQNDYSLQNTKTGPIFQSALGTTISAYIASTKISRVSTTPILTFNNVAVAPTNALSIGTVGIALDASLIPSYYELNPTS